MAEVVGGTVGAVVGFVASGFNPAGAQWGWAIGAVVGGSFTTVRQPRIGELAEVRAGEGGPRARVYGTFRPIGGQVAWAGRPREIRRRQRQGKGGPRVETSTILRSYAIGICEGPITSVSRIWRNNDLVYDVRPGSPIVAESAKWLQGKSLLTGGWDQLPHPTIEAEVGAANAPAMRGTALLVVTDEDLTDLRGAIPAYQFEVGGVLVGGMGQITAFPAGGVSDWGGGSGLGTPGHQYGSSPFTLIASRNTFVVFGEVSGGSVRIEVLMTGAHMVDAVLSAPLGQTHRRFFHFAYSPGAVLLIRLTTIQNLGGSSGFGSRAYDKTLQQLGLLPMSTQNSERLSVIVQSICETARVPSARINTGLLADIPVPGFATSPQYSAAEAIAELGKVYFFDAQDADGVLRFVPRGGSSIATVAESEFVEEESEPEKDTTRDSMSVPRMVHLMYHDLAGGLAADKQMSERETSPRVDAPTVVSTPVILDAASAARVVAVHHRVMEEELRGELVFGLSDARLAITESSVIVVQYRGRSQRCRATKVEMLDGWQRITAVRDRQSAYTAQVDPVPPAPVTLPPSIIPGATRFAFLDLPALSQSSDVLGYHIATSGETAAWRGAIVEREESGAQWAVLATDGTGTVMGTLTEPLSIASEWYSDETNSITVQLARTDDDLASITRAVWLSRGNAAALVRADGTAEIVQFREAVETTPGTWELRGLLRGRLNSGASAHAVGATFVLLEAALLVQAPSERLATTLTHRAYSAGNDPTTAVSQARTWTGRSQREWPPIITAASRAADTLSVSWIARHRFGSDENPVASSHFDGWRIEASSGGTTVGLDATPLTASAALNVAGLANPITVTVRGRNRLAGLGDAATRIV